MCVAMLKAFNVLTTGLSRFSRGDRRELSFDGESQLKTPIDDKIKNLWVFVDSPQTLEQGKQHHKHTEECFARRKHKFRQIAPKRGMKFFFAVDHEL